MNRLLRLPVLFPAVLIACTLHAAAATPEAALHSPWDASPVAVTQVGYKCRPMTHATAVISISGDAAKEANRTRDASYGESVSALDAIVRQVILATRAYQSTGSQAAVNCAMEQMTIAAQDATMTGRIVDTTVAKHEIDTLRALAIAYLVLQPSGAIAPEQQSAVLGWMNMVLRKVRDDVNHAHCGPNGCAMRSHEYLAIAVSAGALGIAEQDLKLYHWAIDQYHDGVGRIDKYGMLHYDTIREYALKYHTDSAASLVQLAEFGEANGEDLYAYRNGRIHMLVRTVTRGLIDPTPFSNATGIDQSLKTPIQPEDIAWAAPYNSRFHDPVIADELRESGAIGPEEWADAPQ